MTNEQFAYWLQGYAEICGTEPNAEQWQVIKDHLQTVFQKTTPVRGMPNSIGQPIAWPTDKVKTSTPLRAECAVAPQVGAVTLC